MIESQTNWFLGFLTELDHASFVLVNRKLANPVFDYVFPAITDLHKSPFFWIVLVLLLAAIFYFKKHYKAKSEWLALSKTLSMAAIAAGISDLTSYRLIKPWFERQRPFDTGLEVVLRTHHHSGYSMPSNHAANMFALAYILGLRFPQLKWFFYTYAFLIAVSRVYVGVHFPSDVLVGASLGIASGWLTVYLIQRIQGHFEKRAANN